MHGELEEIMWESLTHDRTDFNDRPFTRGRVSQWLLESGTSCGGHAASFSREAKLSGKLSLQSQQTAERGEAEQGRAGAEGI